MSEEEKGSQKFGDESGDSMKKLLNLRTTQVQNDESISILCTFYCSHDAVFSPGDDNVRRVLQTHFKNTPKSPVLSKTIFAFSPSNTAFKLSSSRLLSTLTWNPRLLELMISSKGDARWDGK